MSPVRSADRERAGTSTEGRADALDRPEPISKTRRKREMHARQQIGEELVRLSETQLAQLDLPERLLEAVRTARRIQKFGALRRQMQFIGRLMREVDTVTIAARMEVWKGGSRRATARMHALERWRERVIASDRAIFELAAAYPNCDTRRLRALVRNARREQALGEPARSAHELFQALNEVIPGQRVEGGGDA
jgi:ribosome-associated protein